MPIHQRVEEYGRGLKARLAAQGTEIPAYVRRAFEAYLRCGRFEGDFSRVRPDALEVDRYQITVTGSKRRRLAAPRKDHYSCPSDVKAT